MKQKVKWSLEKLQKEALKYGSRIEFKKKSPEFYEAASERGLLTSIVSHMSDSNIRLSEPRKYSLESIQTEALKYKSRWEFQKRSLGHYRAAHSRKILDQVCSHMPKHVSMAGKNNPIFKWSDKKLKEEALKYSSVGEFVRESRSAYFTASARGLLDQVCSHMTRAIRKDWTLKELQQEALKYKTRAEFRKANQSAYCTAGKRKWLEEICQHMKRSCGTSEPEQELFNLIKSIFPKTQKLRDTRVKIENKPHIKGLDLDIFVPELRKAIEFDGTYHHSFGGLKRARPWWPDEDIKNYHVLKDGYFSEKGIQVLHINEADWKKDKNMCINKCLEFLGVKNG
jgi:hypothetical protein